MTVAGGTPTLTLNDGGTATYNGGSGTNALTFSYTVGAGQNTSALAATAFNLNSATISDGAGNAANLSLSGLTQSGPQIDTVTPTITSLTESPSNGDLNAGKTVTFTLNLNEAVTVAGGTPTLTLNDGGTAIYTGGSGTSALTFSYTVGAGQNASALAATSVNLNSATIADGAGNSANLSLSGLTQSGPQIDTTTPAISSLVESPASGDLNAGKTVTLTLNLSEAVTVAGGTPTLTLNDGGTATYNGGSGTNALTFSYTVGAGQNTSALAATAFNLNSATISDGAGNAANLSLSGLTQRGPQIDTVTPTITSLAESPSSGDLNAGKTVTITLNLNESVTVAGGTPTLTLNDGGTAIYNGGSGTNALTFNYTVGAGQNTSALAATAFNLNSATISDGAGNAANLSLSGLTQSGPQIDAVTPTASSLTESPSNGDLNAGKTVTFTLNFNEAVTVAGGTPTLTLNDGGTATYSGGSGTNALSFSYTVGAGQNTAALGATAVNLNSAIITDGAGNAANLSLSGLTQSGPQIDTITPTITSLAESPSSGDLNAGKAVTITLGMSELVTVNTTGGTPTLSLNDGGTAAYTGGSGTNALIFSYTVLQGQNTPDLMETAVNLYGATIADGAGNIANLSLAGVPQGSPQIDTTTPIITSLTESPPSGDLNAGKTVTLTLNLSEAVTVAGGAPMLTLNDGGTATYSGGSGTNAVTFSYTVGAGQNTAALAATAVNLNSATITDGAGNAANLALSGLTQSGPQIDALTPTVSSLVESPASGELNAGQTVTLTLNLSEAVTVASGTPTLTLNNGGTATYTAGSGTNALTFSYTIGAGQNTFTLAATAVNLNSATITDGAGNAANLSLSGLTQSGPQIDALSLNAITPAVVSSLVESPASGDLNAGKTVALTLNLSEAVTVAGGMPTLTLNDGGTATYSGGSGTNALTFNYTVGAGQDTAALAATAVNLNSASITDGAGNAANLSLSGLTQSGPQVDTVTPTAPAISSFTPNGGTAFGSYTDAHVLTLTGSAQANTTVAVFDGSSLLGTASVNGSGAWSYTTTSLSNGSQSFTAEDVDAASNVSAASSALTVTIITAAKLTEINNHYFVNTTTSDPEVQYAGSPVVAGQFGAWTPIGTVQTASGYDVAWKNTATGQYTVWTTDSNGNYTGNLLTGGGVSGTSYALESIEPVFQQDLNGDGHIGPTATVIQTDGSTSLTEIANQVCLNNPNGSGPALRYLGNVVTVGEFGAWTPIGAVQTASGYDVAWKNTATGQYTVWTTDSNGNYTGNLLTGGGVSGTSYALESIEPVFQQDLNGDGHIGPVTTVIQTDGSTSLTEIANQFCLNNPNGSGPALRYLGNVVTVGEFGAWTPIGAVQTASGYDVAWKDTATNQYTVWTTDSNGNYTGNNTGTVSGTNTVLESLGSVFGQDLNGDRVVGIYVASGTTLQITSALAGTSGAATIGAGATLGLAAADSASVTFTSSTGMLLLDHSSTFSGTIFKFTGTGALSGSDQIDLKDIKYSSVHDSYANGVLTVTDGSGDAAKLNFNGSYTLANFKFASDGSGGTIVYDPPVTPSSGQNTVAPFGPSAVIGMDKTLESMDLPSIAFNAQSTLGYLPNSNQAGGIPSVAERIGNANIALLGNYMASMFGVASDNHGAITTLAEVAQHNDQSLLSSPHHA